MMRFFKLSLPENVDNPNTWANSVYRVFEGMPDHLCWVEFRGREQQALHDLGHDYPMEFFGRCYFGDCFSESVQGIDPFGGDGSGRWITCLFLRRS